MPVFHPGLSDPQIRLPVVVPRPPIEQERTRTTGRKSIASIDLGTALCVMNALRRGTTGESVSPGARVRPGGGTVRPPVTNRRSGPPGRSSRPTEERIGRSAKSVRDREPVGAYQQFPRRRVLAAERFQPRTGGSSLPALDLDSHGPPRIGENEIHLLISLAPVGNCRPRSEGGVDEVRPHRRFDHPSPEPSVLSGFFQPKSGRSGHECRVQNEQFGNRSAVSRTGARVLL